MGRHWFSYFYNYLGLLGEEFFSMLWCIYVLKKRSGNPNISEESSAWVLTLVPAFLCEASPTAEYPPNSSPVATVTLPKLPARNNPKTTPWLWFNNRVIVHNCVDFALFIPVSVLSTDLGTESNTTHLQTSLEQTSHLAKQKSRRGPRLKCLL